MSEVSRLARQALLVPDGKVIGAVRITDNAVPSGIGEVLGCLDHGGHRSEQLVPVAEAERHPVLAVTTSHRTRVRSVGEVDSGVLDENGAQRVNGGDQRVAAPSSKGEQVSFGRAVGRLHSRGLLDDHVAVGATDPERADTSPKGTRTFPRGEAVIDIDGRLAEVDLGVRRGEMD